MFGISGMDKDLVNLANSIEHCAIGKYLNLKQQLITVSCHTYLFLQVFLLK